MGSILLLTFMLVVGPLAVLYGADSRVAEARPRGWFPGARD